MNASDVLVERLMEWGVDTIFGLPGDGIHGVFEALRKNKEHIRFIHVRRFPMEKNIGKNLVEYRRATACLHQSK